MQKAVKKVLQMLFKKTFHYNALLQVCAEWLSRDSSNDAAQFLGEGRADMSPSAFPFHLPPYYNLSPHLGTS